MLQGLDKVKTQVITTIANVKEKMLHARADTVGRVDKYTNKYRPYANKYNKWCGQPLPLHFFVLLMHYTRTAWESRPVDGAVWSWRQCRRVDGNLTLKKKS